MSARDRSNHRLVGTFLGWVVSAKDPKQVGRLQVRVPQVYGPTSEAVGGGIADGQLPWALPRGQAAGATQASGGFDWLPKVNDRVVVTFLDGQPEKPLWEFVSQTIDQKGAFLAHQYETSGQPVDRGAFSRYGHAIEFKPNKLTSITSAGHGFAAVNTADQVTSTNPANPTNDPPPVVPSGAQQGPLPAGSGAGLGIPQSLVGKRGGIPNWVGVTPTEGGNATLSGFGAVSNGKGGSMVDAQDNGQGAWGANTANPALIGFAVHPADFVAAGIPYNQWKYSVVSATNPATGQTITAPVVDILGTQGRVDATYGAYQALGGPDQYGGGVTAIQWKLYPPDQAQAALANNDPVSVGQRMDTIGGSPASTGAVGSPSALGVNTQGGPAAGNVSGSTNGRVSMFTRSGPRIDLFDDAQYIHVFAPKSILYASENHWHKGGDSLTEIALKTGMSAAPGAGTVVKTNYGTTDTVLPGADTLGGTYVVSVARWAKIWSRSLLELVARDQLGVATTNMDVAIDNSLSYEVAATLLMQGKTPGSFIPQTTIFGESTTYNFKTLWNVTGPALVTTFNLQAFTMLASQDIVHTTKTKFLVNSTSDTVLTSAGKILGDATSDIGFVTETNFSVAASGNVSVNASGEIDVTATSTLELIGTAGALLQSDSAISITGDIIGVTGKTSATINAPAVTIVCATSATITAGGHSMTISAAGIAFA